MACRQEHEQQDLSVPRNEAPPSEPFPGAPLPRPTFLDGVLKGETLSRLFPAVEVIALESTPDSIIGEIIAATLIQDHWFVLDGFSGKVLKFTFDGQFVQQIGRQGQGPGEYQNTRTLQRVYGDQLGVLDYMGSQIIIYDTDGQHIRTFGSRKSVPGLVLGMHFQWPEENRLYVANFDTLTPDAPYHAYLDLSGDTLKITAGFGSRFVPAQKARFRIEHAAFKVINHRVWAGSPFGSQIEIFDLDGTRLGLLGKKYRPGGVTDEDRKLDFLKRENRNQFTSRTRISKITPFGSWVLVSYGVNQHDIFDQNGNVVQEGIEARKFGVVLLGLEDGLIVSALPVLGKMSYYTEDVQSVLMSQGWDAERNAEDNPYLRLGQPAQSP